MNDIEQELQELEVTYQENKNKPNYFLTKHLLKNYLSIKKKSNDKVKSDIGKRINDLNSQTY